MFFFWKKKKSLLHLKSLISTTEEWQNYIFTCPEMSSESSNACLPLMRQLPASICLAHLLRPSWTRGVKEDKIHKLYELFIFFKFTFYTKSNKTPVFIYPICLLSHLHALVCVIRGSCQRDRQIHLNRAGQHGPGWWDICLILPVCWLGWTL